MLLKLHSDQIVAMHNAADRPVTLYMSAELAAQRAAQSARRSRTAPDSGTTHAILTTDSSNQHDGGKSGYADDESPFSSSIMFNPDRMQSAGGSSTMMAYHTTLGEARGARAHDTAHLVREITKFDSAARKAAIEALKAHIRKDFEAHRRTQPSDALAVLTYPLNTKTPTHLRWVDYHKKKQQMNTPDLNVWFRAEMTPDPHRRGGGDALQREEEEEEKNRNGTQQLLSAGGRRLTPKEHAVMATMGFGSSSNAASSSSMMMRGVGAAADLLERLGRHQDGAQVRLHHRRAHLQAPAREPGEQLRALRRHPGVHQVELQVSGM